MGPERVAMLVKRVGWPDTGRWIGGSLGLRPRPRRFQGMAGQMNDVGKQPYYLGIARRAACRGRFLHAKTWDSPTRVDSSRNSGAESQPFTCPAMPWKTHVGITSQAPAGGTAGLSSSGTCWQRLARTIPFPGVTRGHCAAESHAAPTPRALLDKPAVPPGRKRARSQYSRATFVRQVRVLQ